MGLAVQVLYAVQLSAVLIFLLAASRAAQILPAAFQPVCPTTAGQLLLQARGIGMLAAVTVLAAQLEQFQQLGVALSVMHFSLCSALRSAMAASAVLSNGRKC